VGRNAVLVPNEQINGSAAKIFSTKVNGLITWVAWRIHNVRSPNRDERWHSGQIKNV